jgi:PAS domain S-box-containing protein
MSLVQAQLQFASEFVTLVVTVSALALLLLRPQPRRFAIFGDGPDLSAGRLALAFVSGLALAALAGAAFAHGSVLVSGHNVIWLGFGRMAASVLLLLAFPYPRETRSGDGPVGGLLLRVGFIAWMAAGLAELVTGPTYLIDGLLVAGSVLTAGALLRLARRSIAVRVAASGAVSLLLVVIILALSLSAVISSKLQSQEVGRLSARSAVEKSVMTDTTAVASDAQSLEAILSTSFAQPNPTQSALVEFAAGSKTAADSILARLKTLQPMAEAGVVAYSDPTGRTILVRGETQPTSGPGFGRQPELQPLNCTTGRKGLFEIGGGVWLAASVPECYSGRLLGVAIVANPLDGIYLAGRQSIDPAVSLALISGGHVFSTAGILPYQALAGARGVQPPPGQSLARASGSGFVSVVALSVPSDTGQTVTVELVLSDHSNTVLSTRDQLFRTLFLIAFGGTVLALGLAIFTGDRITAGLRRLTRAAAGIAGGDTSVRAGVSGDDEVASLGSAFDAMLDSVSAQSSALQAAADDEARLRNRLEAVVAGMTDALVAVDSYGRITDFNQAAVELTGVTAASALGAPALRVVRLQTEEGVPISSQMLRPSARNHAMIARVVRGEDEIPVAVSSGALRGPAGELVGTVLVFRDMRREQEVEQMKTEFLSRIGHELRTPLTGILGYADILLRRTVPEERARAWHEDILQSARRLLRIVEMLEFFASEGAGRTVLRPEPIDVRALVNGIASSWTGRLPANLTIGRRVPKGETILTADQRWLTLAVDELIDNAVKFSPEGGRILIKVTPGPESVEISVSDQGMGMTAQHYAVVFGDFVQGDNSDTRRFGGLGLGLAVVRRVVEGHGGTVSGRTAPGRGTMFVIGLPLREGDGVRPETPLPKAPGRAAVKEVANAPRKAASTAAKAVKKAARSAAAKMPAKPSRKVQVEPSSSNGATPSGAAPTKRKSRSPSPTGPNDGP